MHYAFINLSGFEKGDSVANLHAPSQGALKKISLIRSRIPTSREMGLTVASLVISCAICYGIFYIARWHFRRRRFYELASKFDGPPLLPFIGNAHLFIGNEEHLRKEFDRLSQSYPSPFRVWLGPRLCIGVTDSEQAKAVLLSPHTLGKSDLTDFVRPLFGSGLGTAPVTKWKVSRKLIQPTFNTKILESFVEIFATQSKIFTERIKQNLDGPEFEILDLLFACTLDMVCESAMGVKIGAQMDRSSYHVEVQNEIILIFVQRFMRPWLHPDFIFKRTELYKRQLRYSKYLYEFADNVIQKKRKKLLERSSQPETVDDEDDVVESKPRREAFLDHLIKLSHTNVGLTDEELRDEVNTMVFAAYETAALALNFAMLMLASYPDVQERVCEELYEIFGDTDIDDRPVEPKDLPRMKYLERVLRETLRLFPPAPCLVREVAEDIKIGDHIIPNGSSVWIGIRQIQRNEKDWPDPLKFDPDRFLPEETAKRHPYAFLVFAGGPRNCIGQHYGMMAMKTTLATILRRYVLKKDNVVPIQDMRLKMTIVLKPMDPIKIRIERRRRN